MSLPASYPATDDPETRAVDILEYALSRRAKSEIKKRDKVPNYDGTIELVDEQRLPIGKLDVQVKAIPNGKTKYPCPTSLVEYSKTISLPFILICVDVHTERIYWKHIHAQMKEYKPTQQTFTVYFDSYYETIDRTEQYLQQWIGLTKEYRERVAKYPELESRYSLEQDLQEIGEKELIWFQKYIGAFNLVLDAQFASLKTLILPGTWKLGLGIGLTAENWITYRIHRIAYGNPSPLIAKLHPIEYAEQRFAIPQGSSVRAGGWSTDSVIVDRDPEIEGKQDALGIVKKAIKSRPYRVIGKYTSSEQIFRFLDDFWFCLGISQSDEFRMDKLLYGYFRYFPYWCHVANSFLAGKPSKILHLESHQWARDTEMLSKISTEVEHRISAEVPIPATLVSSDRYNFRHIEDSFEYLRSKGEELIRRPYFRHSGILTRFDDFDEVLWRNRFEAILTYAITDYKEFLDGNRIRLTEPSKFGAETSILFAYEFHPIADIVELYVARYVLSNIDGALPRVIVVKQNELSDSDKTKKIGELYLDSLTWCGKPYNIEHPMSRPFHEIFSETPVLDYVYSMLWEDLNID